MCGIVSAVSHRNIVPLLIQGLQQLEYRGYDSCGVAVQNDSLQRSRSTDRVAKLHEATEQDNFTGKNGIAHTRWATHGVPSVDNAHPHFSHGTQDASEHALVGLVHNGIIENHEELRQRLSAQGYIFHSQTDTEVIAHLVESVYEGDLLKAVQTAVEQLDGAYALSVFHHNEPGRIVGARAGSPMVLGLGKNGERSEHFLASDAMALAGQTDQIVYLEEGDVVDMSADAYRVFDATGAAVEREVKTVHAHSNAIELGDYDHYMQKEIFEQPTALANTLEGVVSVDASLFGQQAESIFKNVDHILILACGTSYFSGYTARYWLEEIAGIHTTVEIASEYRYRESVAIPNTLVLTISQSGETADTIAALQHAKSKGLTDTLTVCNVATSAMVRESKLAYITRAGVEIGVASTKAFTAQLASLFLLTLALAKVQGRLTEKDEHAHLQSMRHLPVALQDVLALEPQVKQWAERFTTKKHALFLGRGVHYPVAREGALKLKEISYIHAEAYPAGELKHGPLALVDKEMPIVVVAPKDSLIEKLKSNMEEVRARGGELYVLADADCDIEPQERIHVIRLPEHYGALSPILHTVPLQLLAYHTACALGTDVDKPRNLAKSVTVE